MLLKVVGKYEPDEFVHLLYVSRMRTKDDRTKVLETFEKVLHFFVIILPSVFLNGLYSVTYKFSVHISTCAFAGVVDLKLYGISFLQSKH